MSSAPKAFKALLAGIFLAGIFLPAANMAFHFIPESDLKENRNLASMPSFSWRKSVIENFPKNFEAFYGDNFGFRQLAIKQYRRLKIKLFRISPHQSVLLGEEGWLFYTGDKIIDNYRGLNVFSSHDLEKWRISLERKSDWLKRKGITHLYVIAPEKSSIYPEFIPERFNRIGSSLFDQIIDYLNKSPNLNILDLRKPLLKAKKKFRVYLRTDTHWNNLGALVAYQSILNKLNQQNPKFDLRPFDLSSFKLSYREKYSGDLGHIVESQNYFHEEYIDLNPAFSRCAENVEAGSQLMRNGITPLAQVCPERKLRLLMFRDSFATALIPFISEHFKRSFYINNETDLDFLKKAVEIENPDVVIEEIAERRLKLIPQY